MKSVYHLLLLTVAFACFCCKGQPAAMAQVPVVVPQSTVPVIGYQAERRGLFGQRLVYRPVVIGAVPLAPAATTTVVRSPVVPATYPSVTLARPVLPAAAAEVRYSPVVSPAAYYPPAPVVTNVPIIRTYRVPVVFGF